MFQMHKTLGFKPLRLIFELLKKYSNAMLWVIFIWIGDKHYVQ